jgi:hypothetical protein
MIFLREAARRDGRVGEAADMIAVVCQEKKVVVAFTIFVFTHNATSGRFRVWSACVPEAARYSSAATTSPKH